MEIAYIIALNYGHNKKTSNDRAMLAKKHIQKYLVL